jgi:hypothetical protein
VFDGSESSGTGLGYVLEFGDGASATEHVTTHVSDLKERSGRKQTARLTVTDRFGRSDSVTQDYYVASIATVDFWYHNLPQGRQHRLFLRQQGDRLTGNYKGPENPEPGAWTLSGGLSGQRAVHLRTDNGHVELVGSMEWLAVDPVNMSQPRVVLRLRIRGGFSDGRTLDFRWADLY